MPFDSAACSEIIQFETKAGLVAPDSRHPQQFVRCFSLCSRKRLGTVGCECFQADVSTFVYSDTAPLIPAHSHIDPHTLLLCDTAALAQSRGLVCVASILGMQRSQNISTPIRFSCRRSARMSLSKQKRFVTSQQFETGFVESFMELRITGITFHFMSPDTLFLAEVEICATRLPSL